MPHRPPPVADAGPSLRLRALHLFALSGFAVAQPMLDLLGRHAQFFVAHDSRPADLVALVVVLFAAAPAVLFAAEYVAGLVAPRAGSSLHSVLVSFLSAAIFLQILRRIAGVSGCVWLGAALAAGLATAWAYDRFAVVRSYLTWLSLAPAVFAAAFLFFSPVKELLFPAPYTPPVDVEVAADTPVVMLVFDELSLPTLMDADRGIDAARFPHFAALAATSHWFRNATTTAGLTPWAVSALLTGRYLAPQPGGQQLATASKHPENLFTLLGSSHSLEVFESITNLCPRQLCGPTELDDLPVSRVLYLLRDLAVVYPHTLLPADLANELPEVHSQWRGFLDLKDVRRDRVGWQQLGRRPRIFADFLAAVGRGERRTLYFLQSYLPHVPWQYLPSGTSYGESGSGLLFLTGLSRYDWGPNEWSVTQGFQRYLLQLSYVDRLIGDLIAVLEQADLFDASLVVVTADHGVSFRPGQPRRRVTEQNASDILLVPLFIKLPYQRRGAISDRNAELIDVLPTITEALGLAEPPWPMDGASLLDAEAPERRHKLLVRPPYTRDTAVSFDPGAVAAAGAEAARHTARSFGQGLYRIGPRPELVGRRLAELDVAAVAGGQLLLAHPEIYDEVDPGSGFVPARVVGEVQLPGRARGGLELAVAVNGTVRAVTRSYFHHQGRALFTAMVPESAFSLGPQRLEVFTIDGDGDAPRLIPTTAAPRPSWSRRMLSRMGEILTP